MLERTLRKEKEAIVFATGFSLLKPSLNATPLVVLTKDERISHDCRLFCRLPRSNSHWHDKKDQIKAQITKTSPTLQLLLQLLQGRSCCRLCTAKLWNIFMAASSEKPTELFSSSLRFTKKKVLIAKCFRDFEESFKISLNLLLFVNPQSPPKKCPGKQKTTWVFSGIFSLYFYSNVIQKKIKGLQCDTRQNVITVEFFPVHFRFKEL